MVKLGNAPPMDAKLSEANQRVVADFNVLDETPVSILLTAGTGQIVAALPSEPLVIHCINDAPAGDRNEMADAGCHRMRPDAEIKIAAILRDDLGLASARVLVSSGTTASPGTPGEGGGEGSPPRESAALDGNPSSGPRGEPFHPNPISANDGVPGEGTGQRLFTVASEFNYPDAPNHPAALRDPRPQARAAPARPIDPRAGTGDRHARHQRIAWRANSQLAGLRDPISRPRPDREGIRRAIRQATRDPHGNDQIAALAARDDRRMEINRRRRHEEDRRGPGRSTQIDAPDRRDVRLCAGGSGHPEDAPNPRDQPRQRSG